MEPSYSLCCLHTRLDLLNSCAELLKSIWPLTHTERLQQLENEKCSGMPCSLILIEHQENAVQADSVIGHLRVVPVTNPDPPKCVYFEAVCIEKSKQGLGFGKKLMALAEQYAVHTLGCDQAFLCIYIRLASFYASISYQRYPTGGTVHMTGANLLGQVASPVSWPGNTIPPGWEHAYADPVPSVEEINSYCWMTKYLSNHAF